MVDQAAPVAATPETDSDGVVWVGGAASLPASEPSLQAASRAVLAIRDQTCRGDPQEGLRAKANRSVYCGLGAA